MNGLHPQITKRQLQVIRCLIHGKSEQRIAIDLGISRSCVRKHIQHICERMCISTGRIGIIAAVIAYEFVSLTELRQIVIENHQLSQLDN